MQLVCIYYSIGVYASYARVYTRISISKSRIELASGGFGWIFLFNSRLLLKRSRDNIQTSTNLKNKNGHLVYSILHKQ